MAKLPKFTTDLTPAERIKLLDDSAPDTAATLANKETGGKPWDRHGCEVRSNVTRSSRNSGCSRSVTQCSTNRN